ncbi:unnamed protein product [Macrosiphum euphorbiae]|uniref:Retrotransposon gag domain-containing protein n=1 Tax=Macrosiphum euphorbiae TaxID=13131 RepID=A0AAV0Y9G7_9HEMI|nr:unnamed protein product [Macrosiphum euphorbiae]
MSDKTPFYKPTKFSGAIHENIDSFIQKYNKASNINGWSVEQKKSFLPIYLVNTASTFLDNFENNYPTSNWDQVERALRLEFEPTAQKHMLRTMLEKRKQLPEETTASYINDAENLCKRIDPNMSQSEIAHTIMKGLKPEIARYVGILDNTNLEDLKKNIRKYESIEFMINGKTTQSNDDIRTQITKEHVNIIEENKTKKQIDTLTNQISNLETTINNLNQQIINNNKNFGKSNNNQYTNRPEINRQYTNRLHQGQVNSNKNNYIQNSNYEKRDNRPNYNNSNRYNSNQGNDPQARNSYHNRKPNFTNSDKRIQCEHCNYYNHNSSECKWKLICTICGKRYHTAETCYSKNVDSKSKNE